MGGFLRLGIWEQTATYLELKKVGGKSPGAEATRTDHGEGRDGRVTRDAGQPGEELKKNQKGW